MGLGARGSACRGYECAEEVSEVERFACLHCGWLHRTHVIQGSINATIFNTFLQNSVLPLCNAYPGPRSVLVMDNASIHHSKVRWDTIVNLVLSL